MLDPAGIANWSVTHVDWSEGKWHPKSYRARDVTYELIKNITVFLDSYCFAPSGHFSEDTCFENVFFERVVIINFHCLLVANSFQ